VLFLIHSLDGAVLFLAAAFFHIFTPLSYYDVYPIFEYELEQSILDKLAISLTLNGKIIAVSLNHDMHDYPKLQNIP
jgi:hypothetical protein